MIYIGVDDLLARAYAECMQATRPESGSMTSKATKGLIVTVVFKFYCTMCRANFLISGLVTALLLTDPGRKCGKA